MDTSLSGSQKYLGPRKRRHIPNHGKNITHRQGASCSSISHFKNPNNNFTGTMAQNPNVANYANAAPLPRFEGLGDRENLAPIGNEAVEIPYQKEAYLAWINEGRVFQVNQLTDEQMIQMWETVKTSMQGNTFSEQHMRDIVQMACNLKGVDPATKPLYRQYEMPENGRWADAPSQDPIFSGQQVAGVIVPLQEAQPLVEDVSGKARAIGFICGFLLRFIVKTEEHLNNSLANLKLQFSRIYGVQSATINQWNPTTTWASRIKLAFDTYLTLRATVALHVALADGNLNADNVNFGLCRMLVFQHLELSGLQLYKMTMTLISHLNLISPAKFLSWVYDPLAEKPITQIYTIATTHDTRDRQDQKHWKYAKLARGQYWLDTTVKRNQFFAYVLADLEVRYGLGGKTEYSNPKRMKALDGTPVETRNDAESVAAAFQQMYRVIEDEKRREAGAAFRLARGMPPPPNPPPAAGGQGGGVGAQGLGNVQAPPGAGGQVIPPGNLPPPPAAPPAGAAGQAPGQQDQQINPPGQVPMDLDQRARDAAALGLV
ncbi:nucleocapsid protein [Wheat yellow striate virus]|uniref:Nucleoprotein n=1 Tax=Wheat yellow striate virus TaxID=2152660 RepID=A0A2R4K2H4_9RHAB|nr:nucleocapsid protein [Wheat yellow striate virus]AVV48075.1 nucleocapsid protein [Wheat yellow striate virus]